LNVGLKLPHGQIALGVSVAPIELSVQSEVAIVGPVVDLPDPPDFSYLLVWKVWSHWADVVEFEVAQSLLQFAR